MAMSYLEVRNLSKRFGDFTALGDITLDIGEGTNEIQRLFIARELGCPSGIRP